MQDVIFSVGTSFFKRAAKPERLPDIAGAASVQIELIKLKCKSCSIKKFFTKLKISLTNFIVVCSGLQNRDSS